MGNEQSSGGSCLDRRISIDDDDPILTSEGGSWSLHHGKDKESGASVSVYIVNMKPDDLNVVQLNAQVQIQIVFAFCTST